MHYEIVKRFNVMLSEVEPTSGSSSKITIYNPIFRSLTAVRQASYRQDDSFEVIMHNGLFKKIKDHQMLHHYSDPEKGFGVSSYLWDIIFGSGFPKKSKKES
ncbi:hypothetical protein [Sphingobacterium lumbrici]|uniref:hypothetical protein n=1 Tax=Sphingobacterium lumbrici TaxID=2559600 RepID=UPI0015E48E03|nr:hypothetical protein [Sphingobacterium lumbrici]